MRIINLARERKRKEFEQVAIGSSRRGLLHLVRSRYIGYRRVEMAFPIFARMQHTAYLNSLATFAIYLDYKQWVCCLGDAIKWIALQNRKIDFQARVMLANHTIFRKSIRSSLSPPPDADKPPIGMRNANLLKMLNVKRANGARGTNFLLPRYWDVL